MILSPKSPRRGILGAGRGKCLNTIYRITGWTGCGGGCPPGMISRTLFERKYDVNEINSLNFNPHVHLIGTKELINTETGSPAITTKHRKMIRWYGLYAINIEDKLLKKIY